MHGILFASHMDSKQHYFFHNYIYIHSDNPHAKSCIMLIYYDIIYMLIYMTYIFIQMFLMLKVAKYENCMMHEVVSQELAFSRKWSAFY